MSKRNVPAPTQLRQRMIEDMTVRNLSPATQASYITAVKRFSQYHERSPAALGLEDVRAYQVHLVQHRIAWASLNQIVSALRFVYGVTLGRKDWYSRRVLSWRVSISTEALFCIEALEEALARHGKPEIFNTDQGSQFTCEAFTDVLLKNDIKISMDGKGAWRDNVFVERLWRSVKYEEVYLRAYNSVSDARTSLGRYLDLYNRRRPHSSLDDRTPDQVYFTPALLNRLAA